MSLLVVGASHNTAPVQLRERLAFGSDEAARALDEFWALWPGITLEYLREHHLHKWFFAQPELIEHTLEGLRKAGLE